MNTSATNEQVGMIGELCQLEDGLTTWEVNFVEQISNIKEGDFLDQWTMNKLQEIYDERITKGNKA